MGQVPELVLPGDLRDLQTLLEAEWPARSAALRASGVPLMEGDPAPDPVPNPAPDPTPPPWGDDFDPDRAWALIQKLRGEEAGELKTAKDALADAQAQLKQHEDANKTDQQLARERAEEAERQAAVASRDAARLRVALNKGLTETQAKRLVGDTDEELEADADELLASFKTEVEPAGPDPLRRKPRERLRPGAAPAGEPEETDPAKLAAMVPRRYA